MSFEPVYKDLSFNCKQKLCKTQTVVESRVIPPHGITIARVLGVDAECVMGNAEVFSGEVRYTGRARCKVLFVDGDGQNHYAESNADFSDKIECSLVKSDSVVLLRGRVIDTETTNFSQGEIKLSCVVEIVVDGDCKQDLRCLSASDGLYTQVSTVECSKLVARGNGVVNASNTVNGVKFTSVLFGEHRVVVNSRVANDDTIRVEGVIVSSVCGQSEDGLLGVVSVQTPFVEEMGAIGAHFGDSVIVRAKVSGTERVESSEDGVALVLDYDLSLAYCVYEKACCEIVTDAFSATHELKVTREEREIGCVKQSLTLSDRVEGGITLDANMPIVDNILAINALALSITNAVAGDGEVLLEGVVSGNIVYYSAEANSKNSVAVELPFSIKLNAVGVCDDDEVTAWGEVVATTVKIRRGNEIDLRADFVVETEVCGKKSVKVVCAVEQGDERPVNTCAYSMHIARVGETLWDSAKALCTTPEKIMEQNGTLTPPFKGGEKIVLYRQISK